MKFLPLLAVLLVSYSAHAIAIDESGTSRPKPSKPRLSLVVQLDGSSKDAAKMLKLMKDGIEDQNSLLVEIDLDGDGVMESVALKPDPKDDGVSIGKISKSDSAVSTCCNSSRSNKYLYSEDKEVRGVGNSQVEVLIEDIDEAELIVAREAQSGQSSGRRAGKVKYKNIILRIADPSPELLRKGWDGVVKGGSKVISISVLDAKGNKVDSVKSSGSLDKAETCKDQLCGKTDHF